MPIDSLGYLNNPSFEFAMHKYMGLSCPILKGYEGYYFGKDGVMVDNMGSNLCSAALPGGGFFLLHNDVENFIKECFELAGVPVSKQNVNWLEGIVNETHLKPYRDFIHSHKEPHKAPGAIVPDLDTRFLPVKQPTDASGATKTAIFVGDVKTCWLNKRNYDGAVRKKEQ